MSLEAGPSGSVGSKINVETTSRVGPVFENESPVLAYLIFVATATYRVLGFDAEETAQFGQHSRPLMRIWRE